MNPARVFGPAVVANEWTHHWVWWLSDIGGACLAVIVVRMIFAPIYNSDKTSALWWWRFYRYLRQTDDDGEGGETRKKKKNFQTWGALYRGRRRRETIHDEVSSNFI